MLWLWLLEFISTYKGNNFRMLPGLIRRHLICKLMLCAEKNGKRWSTEQTTDLNDNFYVNIPDKKNELQKKLLSLALKQELEHLPSRQHNIIRRFYLEQESQANIAHSLNCTTRAVRLQQNAALKSIRKNFMSK